MYQSTWKVATLRKTSNKTPELMVGLKENYITLDTAWRVGKLFSNSSVFDV